MTKEELQQKSSRELIDISISLKGLYCLCNTPWKGGWYCSVDPDATTQGEGSTAEEALINLILLQYAKETEQNKSTVDSGK